MEKTEQSSLFQETIQLQADQMRQMIIAIKKARIEKHLSYQNIVDGCEKNGDFVSMSSVRRVCAEGSENQSFRYDTTLRPIARFVLGLDDAPMPSEALEEDGPAATELLRIVVDIKESTIADMKQGIQQREEELETVRQEKDRVIGHLKEQVENLQAEIRTRETGKRRRTIAIVILGILLVLSMSVTIAYMSWDLTHPTQGYFQWEAESSHDVSNLDTQET